MFCVHLHLNVFLIVNVCVESYQSILPFSLLLSPCEWFVYQSILPLSLPFVPVSIVHDVRRSPSVSILTYTYQVKLYIGSISPVRANRESRTARVRFSTVST